MVIPSFKQKTPAQRRIEALCSLVPGRVGGLGNKFVRSYEVIGALQNTFEMTIAMASVIFTEWAVATSLA